MTQPRQTEPFVTARIGFMSEATAFTAEAFDDLDSPPAKTNFYIQNRVKEYLSILDTYTLKNGGTAIVNSGATAFTIQRLGGFARFGQPQTLAQTNEIQTLTGTTPTGTFVATYIDKNNVSWRTAAISGTATSAAVITALTTATYVGLNPGYANPLVGNISGGGGALGTAPVTITFNVGLAGQKQNVILINSSGLTAGTVVNVQTTPGVSGITADGFYVPMYPAAGGRAFSNTDQSAEIDTTSVTDTYMVGAPGRRKITGAFQLITGATITNKAGNVVTLESMVLNEKKLGNPLVIEVVNDSTNVVQPREVAYGYIGNYDKTRPLNGVVERAVTWYLCACPDSDPYQSIDYIA